MPKSALPPLPEFPETIGNIRGIHADYKSVWSYYENVFQGKLDRTKEYIKHTKNLIFFGELDESVQMCSNLLTIRMLPNILNCTFSMAKWVPQALASIANMIMDNTRVLGRIEQALDHNNAVADLDKCAADAKNTVQQAHTLVQQAKADAKDTVQQAQKLVQEAQTNLEIGTHGYAMRMMLEEQRNMLSTMDTRMRANEAAMDRRMQSIETQIQDIKRNTEKKAKGRFTY
mmetsp:Transcript_59943/g.70038  ORF Transcript_59943/g.70038 Transcript_59943/m.70038 type:complete len:230 (-) Transcript_59943:157-846(-)